MCRVTKAVDRSVYHGLPTGGAPHVAMGISTRRGRIP